MTKEELMSIKGGAVTATLLNSIVRGANVLLKAGQYLGSALKRTLTKDYC